MRLETYEDVAALSPADGLMLGFAGDGEGVRAERAETAERLLDEFGYTPRGAFPQFQIVETVAVHNGSAIAALDRLEYTAAQYEQQGIGTEPPLTTAQVSALRDEVIAPMPPPAPIEQVRQINRDYEQLAWLRSDVMHSDDTPGALRSLSTATRTFENTYGFPPTDNGPAATDGRSHKQTAVTRINEPAVVTIEKYLHAQELASSDAEYLGETAVAAHAAVATARDHFARVSEQEPAGSARLEAAENSLRRLQQIEDRINVTSYAGWGVDGVTLHRQQYILNEADVIESDRHQREAAGMAPTQAVTNGEPLWSALDRQWGQGLDQETGQDLDVELEANQYLRGLIDPDDAPRSLAREASDRYDIAASTFNAETIDAVADARVGATAVQFGESIDDASVDLANFTHGWDRVQVHVDPDNRVRAGVIGPNSSTDGDLPAVAAALGISEADANQAVMEAAHQLQRGQVAYGADSDIDADQRVEAFDRDQGQAARESLTWTPGKAGDEADQPGQQQEEQTMTHPEQEQNLPAYRDLARREMPLAEAMRFGVAGDGPEDNAQRVANAKNVVEQWDAADTRAYEAAVGSHSQVDPGLDRPKAADLVIEHGGDLAAATASPAFNDVVAGHEGIAGGLELVDDEDGLREVYVEPDREYAAELAEQHRGAILEGAPVQDGRDATRAAWAAYRAGSGGQGQEDEPDPDEVVNLGMVDDRSVARQGQDRANPGRQPVDMQQVQEQIASLDAVGAGHHDRYAFENTQPTQDDPTMRM